MDIFVFFRDFFVEVVNDMSPGLACFIIRTGLLLVSLLFALGFAWDKLGSRTTLTQLYIAILVIAAGLYFPVDKIVEFLEGWMMAISIALSFVLMIFLPPYLPFLITPKAGNQRRIRRLLNLGIWGLFFVQLIIGG